MKIKKQDTSGFMIATLMVVILIISVLLVTITSTSIANYQSATKEQIRVSAQLAADAGLDIGLHELNLDSDWAGTGGEVDYNTTTSGKSIKTTYDVLIEPGSSAEKKIITSTARAYSPSTNTTPSSTRIYQLEAEAVTTGNGPGSVVSGVGGLTLNNNSKITGGDVIVNGTVVVSNGAQIGLSTNSVNLRVAHQSCPSPVTAAYPQVCTSGQPITANGRIYANVQAQNQTTSTNMSNPGLVSSTFAPIAVPGYDRASHKAAVAVTYASNNSAVGCNKTWPANVKITGNVSLSNNCTVTISGNVWITGTLFIGNNANMIISNTLGATRPVVMIDGSTGLSFGNNGNVTPNSSGTGAEFITTWWNTNTATNGNFTCGGIADKLDCTTVTGLALSTSQATTTINFANNATASKSIMRTLWSRVIISNNGALGAVAGQTVQLGNNAVINFTATIPGSDNLVTAWVKRGYLRVFQ